MPPPSFFDSSSTEGRISSFVSKTKKNKKKTTKTNEWTDFVIFAKNVTLFKFFFSKRSGCFLHLWLYTIQSLRKKLINDYCITYLLSYGAIFLGFGLPSLCMDLLVLGSAFSKKNRKASQYKIYLYSISSLHICFL